MKRTRNIIYGVILLILIIFLGMLIGSRYAQEEQMIYDAVVVSRDTEPNPQNGASAP